MQVKAQIAHFNTICSIGESRDFATVLKDRLAYEKKALIDSMNKLELDIANSAMDSTLEKQFEELFLKTLEKIKCEIISRSDVSVWCESLHIYYPDCPEVVPLEGFLSLDEALRKKFQVEHAGTTRNVSDSFNQLPIEKNNDSLPSPVQLDKPKMVNNLEKLVNSSLHMDFSNNSVFSDLPKNDCLSMTVPRLKVRLQRDSTGNCSGAKVLPMKGEEEIEVCENLIEKREAIISASECAYYYCNANVYKGPGVIHANENITSSEVVSAKNAYYNQIENSGVVERQKFRLEYKSKEGPIEKNKAQKGEIKKNEELRRLQDSKGKTLFNGKDPMDSHNETDKCAEPPFTTSKSTVPSTCDNSKSVDVISERDAASVSTINVDFGGCSCEVENIVEWKRTNEEQIITGQTVNDDLSEVMMDLDDDNDDDDDILCDHKGEEILNNILVEEAVLEGGVCKQTLVVNITEEDCIPSITETFKCKDVSVSLSFLRLQVNYTILYINRYDICMISAATTLLGKDGSRHRPLYDQLTTSPIRFDLIKEKLIFCKLVREPKQYEQKMLSLLCNLVPNRHRDRYNRTINMSFDQLKQCGRFRNRIGYQRKFTSQTMYSGRSTAPVSQLQLQPYIDRAFITAAQLCDRAKFHERYQKFKNDAAAYNQC
uniref:RING-type domain-containing protein n=1 Tax=Heterorhabditis bacteriophora TaxID=37862 RepID=A0A1I7XNR4_HETBA